MIKYRMPEIPPSLDVRYDVVLAEVRTWLGNNPDADVFDLAELLAANSDDDGLAGLATVGILRALRRELLSDQVT